MTDQKEAELQFLLALFEDRFTEKFRLGDQEHAGTEDDFDSFTPLELLHQALSENLDQFAYLAKAIMKLKQEK